MFNFGFSSEEIPEISVVRNSGCNGFRRINHRATTNGEHHVYVFFPAEVDSFIHFRVYRVRLYTTQHAIGNTYFLQ